MAVTAGGFLVPTSLIVGSHGFGSVTGAVVAGVMAGLTVVACGLHVLHERRS
jgi:hypothetical protein